jgi:excisionase family DNA binding protein
MATHPGEFPPVLTAAMAAELLQIHVEYLRKLVREGKVPCHRFPGGRELRFLRDELLEWLAAQPGPGSRGDHEPHSETAAT